MLRLDCHHVNAQSVQLPVLLDLKTNLDDDPILSEMVIRLSTTLHPKRMYVFGSRARGDFGPDSDYDLLVVVESTDEPAYRLSQRGYRALRGIDAAVDVVVWEREAFDARLHLRVSFPATVVREGGLVHVA